MIRLNKLLADRGLGARRKCDEMIQSGAVQVNGTVVTEPGTQVEPGRDRVEVNGRPLPRETALVTYMLHKPVGVISTLSDPEGRRSLRDFMPAGARLFPVGRLDADSSGLLLLTNDGDLAHHLMHPRYGVAKRYRVHLDRNPSESQLKRLQEGVEFEPGVTSSPAQVWARDSSGDEAVIEIAIHEGRHRQVRRMCEAVGLEVKRLHRYGYGPLKLGDLSRGLWRELSEQEIDDLRAASARPAARGGFTGQRSFDRPRVRPRQDRTDRRPAREGFAGRGDGGDSSYPRRDRSGPRGRGEERPRRDRDEERAHGWSHPPTQVWRAEDEGKAAEGATRRPSGGARPGRSRGEGGRPPRERTGARSDRPGFERRPARTFDRPARTGSDRTPSRGFSRPTGGDFARGGARTGPGEGARREDFGSSRRGRDRGGFAPRGGGRPEGARSGFAPRGGRPEGPRGAGRGGFAPRSGGGRTGGGFAPRSGGRSEGRGGFAPRSGARPDGPRGGGRGGFAPRSGGRTDGPRGGGRGGFAPRSGGRSEGPRGGARGGFAPRSGGRPEGPRGAGRGGLAPRGGRTAGPRGGTRGGFAPRGRTGEPGAGATPARRRFERAPRPERSDRGGFPPRGERGGSARTPRGARPGERRGAPRRGNSPRSRPSRRPNS